MLKSKSAVSCGSPLDRHVPTGVEHETVRHIVLEKVIVKNARLTKNYPVGKIRFEKVSLGSQFGSCVEVVSARNERIAYASPRMSPISMTVLGNRTDVYELNFVSSRRSLYGVNKVLRSEVIGFFGAVRIMIGNRGNDSCAVKDIIALFYAFNAVVVLGKISEDDLDLIAVLLLKLLGKLLVGRLFTEKDKRVELVSVGNLL